MRRTVAVACIVVAISGATATAQVVNEELLCPEPDSRLDRYEYLRALSLDLRGELPGDEEYAALDELDDVPLELIDEWLASPAFADRVVRQHRALLWLNVSNQRLLSNAMSLASTGEGLHYRRDLARGARGVDDVPCADWPATYSAEGDIETTRFEDGSEREGYVMVRPYWAPDTEIKVCAFDAQADLVSDEGFDCSMGEGRGSPGCGCGPALRWCGRGGRYAGAEALQDAIETDVEMRIRANIVNDEPYLDLFRSSRAFVNGPLVHYWRHWVGHWNYLDPSPVPMPMEQLPDLEWSDLYTWVEVQLPGYHAGLLTSPAYLMRFQTNRSRANRFYNSFLCTPFVAPRGGIPAEAEGVRPHPDLQQRDGCDYCHATLEPAAAYWGRWPEGGFGHLSVADYPASREDCLYCLTNSASCSVECRAHYLTSASVPEERPYVGLLEAFTYLDERAAPNVDLGPTGLVMTEAVQGRFVDCTARTAFEWLMGRQPISGDEDELIESFELGLTRSNFSYRQMVRAIVTSETYRRVR